MISFENVQKQCDHSTEEVSAAQVFSWENMSMAPVLVESCTDVYIGIEADNQLHAWGTGLEHCAWTWGYHCFQPVNVHGIDLSFLKIAISPNTEIWCLSRHGCPKWIAISAWISSHRLNSESQSVELMIIYANTISVKIPRKWRHLSEEGVEFPSPLIWQYFRFKEDKVWRTDDSTLFVVPFHTFTFV